MLATVTRPLCATKPLRTIVCFALLGLAIAGASYAYAAVFDPNKPMTGFHFVLTLVSVILCPPQLLFMTCIDCEVVEWDGLTMYAIIGALKCSTLCGNRGSSRWSSEKAIWSTWIKKGRFPSLRAANEAPSCSASL